MIGCQVYELLMRWVEGSCSDKRRCCLVIERPIKKEADNPVNQSKLEVITRSRHKARKNVHVRATIGFGFTSDWLKKWRENFEPITE